MATENFRENFSLSGQSAVETDDYSKTFVSKTAYRMATVSNGNFIRFVYALTELGSSQTISGILLA